MLCAVSNKISCSNLATCPSVCPAFPFMHSTSAARLGAELHVDNNWRRTASSTAPASCGSKYATVMSSATPDAKKSRAPSGSDATLFATICIADARAAGRTVAMYSSIWTPEWCPRGTRSKSQLRRTARTLLSSNNCTARPASWCAMIPKQ